MRVEAVTRSRVNREVGVKLRMLRKATGMTREELGALLGVSGPAVTNWENGSRGFDGDDIRRVAGYLGVDPCLFVSDWNTVHQAAQKIERERQAAIAQQRLPFLTETASPFDTTIQRALASAGSP